LHQACQHIHAGGDVAIAIGAEKLFSADKARSLGAFEGSWDISTRDANIAKLIELEDGCRPPDGAAEDAPHRSVFIDVLAALARFHMSRYGVTQRQIAAVAAKNQSAGALNDKAQYGTAMSIEDVLAARAIRWPLTLPMCAPISDGAAAVIVCSDTALRRLGTVRSVAIRTCTLGSGSDRHLDEVELQTVRMTADAAYAAAGVSPADVDVAEVHDASAFNEILHSENLGLFPRGDGGPAAERGFTAIGGRIPINPSGGMESKGHPLGATGLAQVAELTTQLRGEAGARQVANARMAVAQNAGGFIGFDEASCVVTVLEGHNR
jgi:acetyl-CoA acyltransferase